MPLVIRKTSWEDYLDPSGGAFVKALVMGGHGAGKTRSASFWPKPIFADCEEGRMSIADRGVPYGAIKSSADMDALLDMVKRDGQLPVAKRQYQTLVIDTIDAYQRTLISERLKAEKKESLSGWADWGYLDGKMSQLIERLLNLPINLIVNMHVKEVSDGGDADGDNSILVRKARLKGDIKDTIFQDFDLIGQMETSYRAVKGERVLERNIRWQAEPRFPNIRDRSGKLPRFTLVDFTDQDYWRIFNALTGDLDSMPAPETVTTLETGKTDAEITVPGPDEQGGPVAPPPEAVKKKGERTPAKKAAPAMKAEAAPAPEPTPEPTPEPEPEPAAEPATPVEDLPVDPWSGDPVEPKAAEPVTEPVSETTEPVTEPEQLIAEVLGGEVVERVEGQCGYIPESHRQFKDQPDGCSVDLSSQNRAKVNLSLLRAHATLCESCFDAWKAQSAA